MSTDINSLLSQFKTNMMNNGVTVESGDKFKQLIDKIVTMVEEGSGKGIQFEMGTDTIYIKDSGSAITKTVSGLKFIPTYVFCFVQGKVWHDDDELDVGYTIRDLVFGSVGETYWGSGQGYFKVTINDNNSFTIKTYLHGSVYEAVGETPFTWYAIGVGEEDTTIESSIISILKTKGYDESKDNIIDFIENKLYTKVIEPGTNVTIATGEGLESRRSENNQLFTKSLIVPSLSNLGSDNIKGLSLKVVTWAYHDDLYGPKQYSMKDGYFRIQIKRDGVIINNVFESSAYTYNYNNGNGTTHTYDLLDVQEGDVIEYTVGYYASGFLGTNVHEYHFGVKEAYLTYSLGYVTSL